MELVGLKVSIEADTSAIKSAFTDLSRLMSDFNNQIKAVVSSGVFKQITDEQIKSAKAGKELADTELTLAKAMNETLKSKLSQLKIDKEIEAGEARKLVNKRREKDAYSELVATRNDSVRSMFNEFAEMKKGGATLEEFIKKHQSLIATLNKEQQELKDLESVFGRNQRNVGNYTNSFNGLNNSVMQITRELPAFTFSIQTGLMGISNNIGPLADALQDAKKKNEALKMSGEASVPVWKQLGGAIFSWQTALSVGVTLLTVYGDKVVESIFKLKAKKEAVEKAKKSQDDYNNSLTEAIRKGYEEVAHLKMLQDRMTNVNNSMLVRQQAYNEAVRLYPSYFNSVSKDMALTGGLADIINNKLIPAIIASAKARAYESRLEKRTAEIIDLKEKNEELAKQQKMVDGITDSYLAQQNAYDLVNGRPESNDAVQVNSKISQGLDVQIAQNQKIIDLKEQQNEIDAKSVNKYQSIGGDVSAQKTFADNVKASEKAQKNADKLADEAQKEYEKKQEEFRKLMIKVSNNLRKTQDENLKRIDKDLEKLLNKDLDKNRPILRAIEFKYYIKADEKEMLNLSKKFIEDLGKALETLTQDSLIALGEGIGSMISGDMGLGGVLKSIGGLVADFVVQVGKMLIQMGVQMAGIKTAIKALITNPYVAIAAGIGAVAVGTAMKKKLSNQKIRPFADGGIVSGRTNALIGEYAGARSNPEVVAPLNKLEGILQGMNLGGNNVVVLETIIKGSDLVLSQQRENRRKK